MTPSDVLSQFSLRLKNKAPKEWDEFCECFDAYATAVVTATVNAEQNEILNRQGRAQLAVHLLQLFRDCHKQPPPKAPPSAPQQP